MRIESSALTLTLNESNSEVADRSPNSELLLATGADVDRGRIVGAEKHALFPCHPEDTVQLASRIQERRPQAVCVAVGWDRPGPGLEFAGWLAARRKRLRLRNLNVVVVAWGP